MLKNFGNLENIQIFENNFEIWTIENLGKNGNNFEIRETFENLEKFQKFGMFWKFRTKFGNLEKKLEIWEKGRNLGGKLEICR